MAGKSTSWRTSTRSRGSSAASTSGILRTGSRFGIDAALVATAILMLATDMTVLFFYSLFFWLSLGAFFWRFKAFALRAGVWTTVGAAEVGLTVLTGGTQPEELTGLPLLISILVLVLVTAWRWREDLRIAPRYELFDSNMDIHVSEQGLEDDLRLAIERNEFEVHYQPVVSLESGRITEVEALVRWNHHKRGLLSPTDFIPLAEETGLILPIGQQVLYEACRQTCVWHNRFESAAPLLVSVNFSAEQVREANLVQNIVRTLQQTGLQASSLQVEIAESALTEDGDLALQALRELKAAGLHSAIDNFGKGYSSLNYLKRLSVDTLKVDRSLIQKLGESAEYAAVVQLIVNLAHTLGLQAAAEGIETAEQSRQLREMGCDLGQGSYFSRPLPAPEVSALLARISRVRHPQEQFRP